MYVYTCTCTWVYTYVSGCSGVYLVYIYIYLCVWLRVAALWNSLMRSGPLQETRTRFGFVLVMDPIQWRFEDCSIGWSVDQYRFVQWRPDGDSVSKQRHFMWVFVLVHFLIYRCRYAFTFYTYHFMWHSVIFYLFDYLYHFIRHPWLLTLIT